MITIKSPSILRSGALRGMYEDIRYAELYCVIVRRYCMVELKSFVEAFDFSIRTLIHTCTKRNRIKKTLPCIHAYTGDFFFLRFKTLRSITFYEKTHIHSSDFFLILIFLNGNYYFYMRDVIL